MEDKVSQNTEQASNLSQDSFCLCLWVYLGFFSSCRTDFNRIRYFPTCFFAGIQSEICSEESLGYMRHKYMHYFAPQRKKDLAGMLQYINSIVPFRILCQVEKCHYFETIRQNLLFFLIAWMCTGFPLFLHFTG